MANFKQLFCILSLVALSASCGTLVDGHIDLAYQVEAGRKSPLSTIKPLGIRVEMQDRRAVGEPQLIGHKKGGFGNILASVKAKQEVAEILRLALEGELQHNGHVVSRGKESKSDATLAVRLKKFWTEPTVKVFDVQVLGTVDADIELVDSGAQRITSRTIVGTQIESWQLAIDEAYDSVLNGALREFIRNFARDPNLLKALRDISSR